MSPTARWARSGLLFVALLGAWTWTRPAGGDALGKLVMLVAYAVFSALELGSARREDARGAAPRDRGTFEWYAAARAITVLAGALAPGTREPSALQLFAGLVLLAAGATLRISARRALGELYSHRVRILDQHRVVTTGPYRYLRHPSYAGMLLAHAGFVAVFCHPLSVVSLLLLFVPAVLRRIAVEEGELAALPGYADYALKRKRLAPGVW